MFLLMSRGKNYLILRIDVYKVTNTTRPLVSKTIYFHIKMLKTTFLLWKREKYTKCYNKHKPKHAEAFGAAIRMAYDVLRQYHSVDNEESFAFLSSRRQEQTLHNQMGSDNF